MCVYIYIYEVYAQTPNDPLRHSKYHVNRDHKVPNRGTLGHLGDTAAMFGVWELNIWHERTRQRFVELGAPTHHVANRPNDESSSRQGGTYAWTLDPETYVKMMTPWAILRCLGAQSFNILLVSRSGPSSLFWALSRSR